MLATGIVEKLRKFVFQLYITPQFLSKVCFIVADSKLVAIHHFRFFVNNFFYWTTHTQWQFLQLRNPLVLFDYFSSKAWLFGT